MDLLPESGQSAWDVVSGNWGPLVAFLFTFAVVAIMWSAHNRVLNGIVAYDAALFWLNVAWLAGIVVLPWFGMSVSVADGAAIGVIFTVISLVRSYALRRLFNAWHKN